MYEFSPVYASNHSSLSLSVSLPSLSSSVSLPPRTGYAPLSVTSTPVMSYARSLSFSSVSSEASASL